jgi:hypothetical protein
MGKLMDLILTILRILTAVVAPISAVIFVILSLVRLRQAQGRPPKNEELCLRCGQARKGGDAQFHYTDSTMAAGEQTAKRKLLPSEKEILGSETHFVCDHCARRALRNEIGQVFLMMLPYPLYLYLIVPLFLEGRTFANFLIETLLVVMAVIGVTTAYYLFRTTHKGQTPLTEGRDQLAIYLRKSALGKKLNYYTRFGSARLKK